MIITVSTAKGGAGKTTSILTIVNGGLLCKPDLKFAIVDTDTSVGSLTRFWMKRTENELVDDRVFEPRRVCRRLIDLSYAAISDLSRAAQKFDSASAGGIFPIGSSRRRLLNQSTHSRVAYSKASKLRHGPGLN